LIKNNKKSATCKKFVVFTLCFISYTGLHICRNAWSYCANEIEEDFEGWKDTTLSQINFVFMLGYGTGQFLNGWLVD